MLPSHRFFALEGPDGAGKTTLAAAVADRLKDRGLQHVDRRQISTTSPYTARLMEPLATMLWHCGDDLDLPDGFWAHLQASWFTAHGRHVVGPALQEGPVVVDGWYYKLCSRLILQGWGQAEVDQLFSRVRAPDHVILLRADPKELWKRKGAGMRLAELGMHAGYEDLGEASFLDYQQRSLDVLGAMASERGWSVVDVPGGESAEETTGRLAQLITGLLDERPAQRRRAVYAWPRISPGLREGVLAQLDVSLSDRDASGVIGRYEREFAAFAGSRHALSFSSGTAALHAMCVAAGLGPGDEVIAPAYTFFATASPFAYEGVTVRFADADRCGNLDPGRLPGLVTERTRAVIVTHMWGTPCEMDAIGAFCRDHGLLLLEDCSHAHFASYRGRRVGTFGAMAAFSTNQKAITTGEGGVLVTDDDRYRDLALLHGHYNQRCRTEISPAAPYAAYAFTGMGLKSRMTTLGATIGLHQLQRARDVEKRRRAVLARFARALEGNPAVSLVQADPARGQQGLYVMGLRFHPGAATCTLEEFVTRLTTDGADFDIPGSTRVIAGEPLFHRPERNGPWDQAPAVPGQDFPGARAFTASFFKGPLWGYEGDEPHVEHQLRTLVHHAGRVTA